MIAFQEGIICGSSEGWMNRSGRWWDVANHTCTGKGIPRPTVDNVKKKKKKERIRPNKVNNCALSICMVFGTTLAQWLLGRSTGSITIKQRSDSIGVFGKSSYAIRISPQQTTVNIADASKVIICSSFVHLLIRPPQNSRCRKKTWPYLRELGCLSFLLSFLWACIPMPAPPLQHRTPSWHVYHQVHTTPSPILMYK